MSRVGVVGLVLALSILAVLAVGSMNVSEHRCEVCMKYNGRTQCRTVAGATVDLARDGAIQNACAFLSGGVTDSMACHREPPQSEKCQ
jgi:hypothetical protein